MLSKKLINLNTEVRLTVSTVIDMLANHVDSTRRGDVQSGQVVWEGKSEAGSTGIRLAATAAAAAAAAATTTTTGILRHVIEGQQVVLDKGGMIRIIEKQASESALCSNFC